MVDWAVVLRPVGALGGALARARQQPDGDERFFNHSRYRSLIDKPFAISVETKPEGEDIRQAYIQLAVWTSTHMNFLSQLLGDTASSAKNLPHLPLLIVQGSLWSFLCASRKADGSTDIHTKIDFGDASTRYGVFIIVSVLQLLVDWAEVHYRPWFEEHCVVKE
ncbi:hypothetical protein M436DRAFT_43478 [Aureobasidium namibiae CBS 147.97]|uniref:PD-(D/E)XK nuclease-like domain-containing protein n=1 Tax=Aureobasidium namibiae CBS 147.97 TaxID=1043004 RepID=A0A074WRW2_9PEZI|nr:uncharacterized protein M436DRAFT_43478 [Aureobasidium namibiae CBS 147.97]KEQ74334.1 hypothetical protein M436DRAFT_43478 [Aureobasidium namibiae CBS 147.97]